MLNMIETVYIFVNRNENITCYQLIDLVLVKLLTWGVGSWMCKLGVVNMFGGVRLILGDGLYCILHCWVI